MPAVTFSASHGRTWPPQAAGHSAGDRRSRHGPGSRSSWRTSCPPRAWPSRVTPTVVDQPPRGRGEDHLTRALQLIGPAAAHRGPGRRRVQGDFRTAPRRRGTAERPGAGRHVQLARARPQRGDEVERRPGLHAVVERARPRPGRVGLRERGRRASAPASPRHGCRRRQQVGVQAQRRRASPSASRAVRRALDPAAALPVEIRAVSSARSFSPIAWSSSSPARRGLHPLQLRQHLQTRHPAAVVARGPAKLGHHVGEAGAVTVRRAPSSSPPRSNVTSRRPPARPAAATRSRDHAARRHLELQQRPSETVTSASSQLARPARRARSTSRTSRNRISSPPSAPCLEAVPGDAGAADAQPGRRILGIGVRLDPRASQATSSGPCDSRQASAAAADESEQHEQPARRRTAACSSRRRPDRRPPTGAPR